MLWFLYGVAILMVWYENRWIVCAWPLDRPMWFSPTAQSMYWIVRLAVTYGTLIGLWATRDLTTAGVAFGAYYVLNKVTFRVYFNREVQQTAQRYARLSTEEAQRDNRPLDHSAVMQDALELAKTTVVRNMKGGRF